MGRTVRGVWPFEQMLNLISTVGSTWNLVKIGQVVWEENLLNNIMILYMYTAQGEGKIPYLP